MAAWAGPPRRVVDMAGRKVDLPAGVNRIVTTFKPATLCVLALGLGDRLVGVDPGSTRERLQISVIPALAKAVPVGDKSKGVNFETVVSLKPDLVVLYAQSGGPELAGRLASLGIAAVVILPEDFAGLERALSILASAVGEPQRAARVAAAMRRVLALAREKTKALPQSRRKVVYYASPQSFFSTASGSMLQDEMIRRAGGINAGRKLTGYFQPVSPEQLLVWNPGLIAASSRLAASLGKDLARPEVKALKAAAEGKIYIFPSNITPWDFPSPLCALGVLWLGTRLYPDLFCEVDLLEEVNEFHRALFAKSFFGMGGELADQVRP